MELSDFIEAVGTDAGAVKLYDAMMLNVVDLIKGISSNNRNIFNDVHVCDNQKGYRECMNTLSTYECSIFVDGKAALTIPVPIGSCHKVQEDKSAINGSFVIEGRRKVLMCQEKNHTFRYSARKEKCELQLPKCRCEVYMVNGVLKVALSHDNLVNIFVVMKDLGRSVAETKRDILSWTSYPKRVSGLLLESQLDSTTLDNNINSYIEKLLETLENDKKVQMLSLMICRFAETILLLRPEDDRDCLSFKRVHTPADIVHKCVEKRIGSLDYQKIKNNDKQKAFIVSALGRIARDIQSNFKTSIWDGYA